MAASPSGANLAPRAIHDVSQDIVPGKRAVNLRAVLCYGLVLLLCTSAAAPARAAWWWPPDWFGGTGVLSPRGYPEVRPTDTTVTLAQVPAAAALPGTLREIAISQDNPKKQTAAIEDFLDALQRSLPTEYWRGEYDVGEYVLEFPDRTRPYRPHDTAAPAADPLAVAEFDMLVPASRVSTSRFPQRIVTPGRGVPFVAVRFRSPDRQITEPFQPRYGTCSPATVLVEFWQPPDGSAPRARLHILNPNASPSDLAADYTAPLALYAQHNALDQYAFDALIDPGRHDELTGLAMLESYQPRKIPVVLIHGLESSPETWLQVINGLRADPEIRRRYQFWVFMYPSGYPVLYSGYRLRSALQSVRRHYDPAGRNAGLNNMVLVGHSMGGLLVRLMVCSSGNTFWNTVFDRPVTDYDYPEEDGNFLKNMLFFQRQPYVSRAVFIATPHAGSRFARGAVGLFGASLVKLPSRLANIGTRIVVRNVLNRPDAPPAFNPRAFRSGIENLKPDSPFIRALAELPPAVPFHSIIGNQGVRAWWGNNDGYVQQDSAKLSGAQSEVLVPSRHDAHKHRAAIAELARILREN